MIERLNHDSRESEKIPVTFIFDIRIWYNKRGFLYNKIYFWRINRVCIGQIHELFLSLLSY